MPVGSAPIGASITLLKIKTSIVGSCMLGVENPSLGSQAVSEKKTFQSQQKRWSTSSRAIYVISITQLHQCYLLEK